ncbi:hypothetical protein C1645_809179 [Glomus cerebriforme]|uniref:Uncharacterized protein n=1 Tax=Glomus cerebriforme TaxID=658196 RepID=A0A397SH21_9GLOM|nr:hypothetical protein C1645_809179 [Glomus cerebriforme]
MAFKFQLSNVPIFFSNFGKMQRRHTINYNQQPKNQNFNQPRNNKHDKSWECFRNFDCVHMWDGFVYLFISVCDSEKDLNSLMNDFDEMRNKIFYLHQNGGASEDKYQTTNEIINQYLKSRKIGDEDMRNKVMLSVFRQLEAHNIYEPCLSNMINLFNEMSRFQRKSLREICISRIYGYSKFAEYLFKEWSKKHYTKNKIDEDFQQEDKKSNAKEQSKNKKSSNTDISNSECEGDSIGDNSMEKKHDYKKTINNSSTIEDSKENENITLATTDNAIEKKTQEIQKRDSKLGIMKHEIEQLRKEAAKYQAALGGITDVGWRDNDFNNSMQLTKDIEKLQKDLENFTRVKRQGIKIKIDAASRLLETYKCKTQKNDKNIKLVLSAALQQHLVKIILESADNYFEQALDNIVKIQENDSKTCIIDDELEAVILFKIKELIELVTRFERTRTGTDEHSRVLPIKLRQQIYAALGHRGFSKLNHPFITRLTKNLIDEMNKYRIIESQDKNEKVEKEIITIVIQVLRIFYFRIYTQEPIPSLEFYKSGEYFDPNVMESISQIGQSDDGELEIEICSFPVVALIENLDEEMKRVFTKAQVIVRPKKRTF